VQAVIRLTFKATSGREPRDILVDIHEPIRSPPEAKWPWAITVDVEGRSYTTYGVDPLDAIENGSQHAARLLHGLHHDMLDPPLEPRR
jgi:hypothetical protein